MSSYNMGFPSINDCYQTYQCSGSGCSSRDCGCGSSGGFGNCNCGCNRGCGCQCCRPSPCPTGPTGPTGATGPTGPTGATGATGPGTITEILTATNIAVQTPGGNTAIAFDTTIIDIGSAITHVPGSALFSISTPGYYQVMFNANVSSSAAAFPADAFIQMYQNGTPVPCTLSQVTLADDGDVQHISFSTIVFIATTPINLSVVSGVANTIFTNASISIQKIS